MNLNPEELSDEEWARAFQDYSFVEEREQKILKNTFEAAIAKVVGQLFGNG